MSEKKTIFRHPIFHIAVVLACAFSTLLLALDQHPVYYPAALLPVLYLPVYLFSLVITPKSVYHNIGYVLYFGQSLIKCVIAPMFLALGDYSTLFGGLNSDYVLQGVLLLIYEHLVCTVVIALSTKSVKLTLKPPAKLKLPKLKPATVVFWMSAAAALLWVIVPEIRHNFVTVFDMISSQEMFSGYDYTTSNAVGTIGRILTTLFLVLFKSVRILLPFYLIKALKERFDNWVSFLLSMVIILLQFLFISETVAMPLVVAFMLLYYMLWAYPKYKRAIITAMSVSAVFVVFVLSLNFDYMAKWHGVEKLSQYVCQILQSYVPGLCNTASIFRVMPTNRLTTLLDTLLSTIPFRSTLFGASAWNNDLNTLYTSTYGLKAQIVSTVGGGWYIFGYALAPLFSAIFVRVSMINGNKFTKTDNELKRLLYLFMCIQTMLGIGVYNIQSTISLWIQVGLVLLVCANVSKITKKDQVGS